MSDALWGVLIGGAITVVVSAGNALWQNRLAGTASKERRRQNWRDTQAGVLSELQMLTTEMVEKHVHLKDRWQFTGASIEPKLLEIEMDYERLRIRLFSPLSRIHDADLRASVNRFATELDDHGMSKTEAEAERHRLAAIDAFHKAMRQAGEWLRAHPDEAPRA